MKGDDENWDGDEQKQKGWRRNRVETKRNSENTQTKSEFLAKIQNEHKLEKGLALIPHEANNYSLIQIILPKDLEY